MGCMLKLKPLLFSEGFWRNDWLSKNHRKVVDRAMKGSYGTYHQAEEGEEDYDIRVQNLKRRFQAQQSSSNQPTSAAGATFKIVLILCFIAVIIVSIILGVRLSTTTTKDIIVKLSDDTDDRVNDKSVDDDEIDKVSSKPNFVFIIADDLGWNSLGKAYDVRMFRVKTY